MLINEGRRAKMRGRVCVCERERERERNILREWKRKSVCVCVREREREKHTERVEEEESDRRKKLPYRQVEIVSFNLS